MAAASNLLRIEGSESSESGIGGSEMTRSKADIVQILILPIFLMKTFSKREKSEKKIEKKRERNSIGIMA